MSVGIYKITCGHNGYVYAGASTHLETRIATHKNALKAGKHSIESMQKDYLEHAETFTFDIVEANVDHTELSSREQIEIDKAVAEGKCYNLSLKSADIWSSMAREMVDPASSIIDAKDVEIAALKIELTKTEIESSNQELYTAQLILEILKINPCVYWRARSIVAESKLAAAGVEYKPYGAQWK